MFWHEAMNWTPSGGWACCQMAVWTELPIFWNEVPDPVRRSVRIGGPDGLEEDVVDESSMFGKEETTPGGRSLSNSAVGPRRGTLGSSLGSSLNSLWAEFKDIGGQVVSTRMGEVFSMQF